MATAYVKHQVKDFNSWKRTYDDFAPVRKEKGVIGASVHREVNDPNSVVVMHRFGDRETAKAFLNSPDLKSAMERSGVVGQPEIWLCDDEEVTFY